MLKLAILNLRCVEWNQTKANTNLFKHKVRSAAKTELIIFLTPHIVMAPSQLAGLSATERSKMELTPKAFTEQELNRFIDGLPVKESAPAIDPAPNKKDSKPNKSRK